MQPWDERMAEEAGGGALVAAYRLAGICAAPFLPLVLSWRVRQGKEDGSRLGERRGIASAPRPEGFLVWVHAASVGETNAVLPLIGRLTATSHVLLTTVTVTGAQIAAARLPHGAVHQFGPLDIQPWIGRFLDHWRPDLALFAESELWPVTMTMLAERGVPQVLVNGRLSERSFERWRRYESVARPWFARLALCLAQSPLDAERYRAMGVSQVEVTGNLKFDAPLPVPDTGAVAALRQLIGERPVWMAASTHEGEETIAARVHRELAPAHPGLLTVIVPRHPARGSAVAAALRESGHQVALRSKEEAIAADTEIYVADTLGELALFYRVVPVAFMGGSLVPHGGQNPIEPVRFEAAVLHGPHVHNFADIYVALDASGSETVADAEQLAAAVHRLLADPARARNRVRAAAAALQPFAGALDATLAALKPFLEARAMKPAAGATA
jgi:3-deoxy-D-manno-octulosonic-acid transferase